MKLLLTATLIVGAIIAGLAIWSSAYQDNSRAQIQLDIQAKDCAAQFREQIKVCDPVCATERGDDYDACISNCTRDRLKRRAVFGC